MSHFNHQPRRAAFTLVEMMIAMTVCSFIALGAVSTLLMLSTGTEDQYATRQRSVAAITNTARVTDVVHEATRLLGVSSNTCVFWTGDINGDGLVNLAELCAIFWDSTDQTVARYALSPLPTGAANTGYATNTNFVTLANTQINAGTWAGRTLVKSVTQCQISAATQPTLGRPIIRLDLTFDQPYATQPIRIVASVRGESF